MNHKQIQINKQMRKHLEDQSNSFTILGNILSELEKLAIYHLYPGREIFGFHKKDCSDTCQDIVNRIIYQLTIFKISYNDMTKKYGNYSFPQNLDKYQVIAIVMKWKEYLKSKNVSLLRYYDEFLNILNYGRFSDSFTYELEKIK